MQSVRLLVTGRARYTASDRFEVFGDGGSGIVDFDKPLNDRPIAFWPAAVPRRGHLLDKHLAAPHADSVFPDGHLEGVHLVDNHGRPSAPVVFNTPGYEFGVFRHAIRPVDRAGNASAGASEETAHTVNSSPPRPFDFVVTGFDDGTGQVVFGFRWRQ